MSRPTIQLFVNPRAGSCARARTDALSAAFEARGARVILTASQSERLVVDDRADQVCAIGGDGTLRHVAAAVRNAGRPIPISVYPAGTVNLFAMEYGYPRDAEKFVQHVLHAGGCRRHHGALIGQTPLLSCASVGPDSYTVDALSPTLKRLVGRAAYLAAFCLVLVRWRRVPITLLHDDRRTECEAAYIARSRYFAGPWSFAPEARGSEPLLYVVTLRKASRTRFLLFAWALLRHRPVAALAGIDTFTCQALTLCSDGAPPLQADGDIVSRLPASIRLEPEAFYFT